MKNKKSKIWSRVFTIVVIIIAIVVYRKYDYNFYMKGIAETGKTTFSRDSSTSTNNKRSYKIENADYNDAMFFREIEVTPFTPYKVSCYVKTENVKQFEDVSIAGAQIVLKDVEEHSEVISGTSEWKKLELCFNSKNNNTVTVGFRLGGNGYKAKGTAWFSDIKIEQGFKSETSTWNFAVFILHNLDAEVGGSKIRATLENSDIYNLQDCVRRTSLSLSQMTKNKMKATYKITEITDPITTLSYDKENGYFPQEKDVYNLIEQYVKREEYDHIFVCIKMPDEKDFLAEEVTNWVGLGGMEYCGKGLSIIRVPNSNNKNIYKYASYNTFPEEVFIHEFLHTLERNALEYGYERPELHSYSLYGYKEDRTNGLYNWYTDYMNKKIEDNGNYVGLPEEIYSYSPVQLSDFTYSNELKLLKEPSNIIEVIKSIGDRIGNLFKRKDIVIQIKGVTS